MLINASLSFLDYRLSWLQGRQEIQRQRLVRLIFLIYWLLIFEGALRKWGFPGLRDVFFFIRVPVMVFLYGMALMTGRWPKAEWPLVGAYVAAILGTALIPFQMLTGGYEFRYLAIAGYGWINYFFYIPLTFLIADQFREADIRALIRHTLWIAVAATPLVILQFYSPSTAVINQGSGLDEATQFKNLGAYLGYVRPNGFFTSTEGQAAFVTSVMAFVMLSWLLPAAARPTGRWLLLAATFSVLAMATLGQSRGLFFLIGMVLVAGTIAGFLTKNVGITMRSAIGPILLVGVGVLGWPLLFPEAFEAFTTRWVDAQAAEGGTFQGGVYGRAFYGFYDFIYYLEGTPVFGYLIGLGGNAIGQIGWVKMPDASQTWNGYGGWAEGGWARHIIELGPWLGTAYISYRIVLTGWLIRLGVRSARLARNPLPVLLIGGFGVIILNGQITGNGTSNGYAWIILGLCLASARTSGAFSPHRKAQ